MWYTVLPCMTIMTCLMASPQVFSYYVHKLFQNGNPYRRSLRHEVDRRQFLRDERITGNAYVIAGSFHNMQQWMIWKCFGGGDAFFQIRTLPGLEAIPDE